IGCVDAATAPAWFGRAAAMAAAAAAFFASSAGGAGGPMKAGFDALMVGLTVVNPPGRPDLPAVFASPPAGDGSVPGAVVRAGWAGSAGVGPGAGAVPGFTIRLVLLGAEAGMVVPATGSLTSVPGA